MGDKIEMSNVTKVQTQVLTVVVVVVVSLSCQNYIETLEITHTFNAFSATEIASYEVMLATIEGEKSPWHWRLEVFYGSFAFH